MAASVNKAILIGNLGRDPEIRTARSGDKIANLSLATSESWQDKRTGERQERTEWHRVVCTNPKLSEVVEKYLSKGAKIYVEGQIQTKKWTDKNGAERFTTEVVIGRFNGVLTILDSKRDDGQAQRGGSDVQRDADYDETPF